METGQKAPPCAVPTWAILVFTTVISTTVSGLGGLVLYFEGLDAIEDTVRQVAEAETLVAVTELQRYFDETSAAAKTMQTFFTRSSFWASFSSYDEIREFALPYLFSLSVPSRRLGGASIAIMPNRSDPVNQVVQGCWWDALTDPIHIERNGGDKQWISAEYIPGDPDLLPGNESYCGEYNISKRRCITGHELSPEGIRGGVLYHWQANHRAWDNPFPWRYSGVYAWKSPDGTPYLYTLMMTLNHSFVPGHPLLGGTVDMKVFLMLYDWTDDLRRVGAEAELVAVDMLSGVGGRVYASSVGEAVKCAKTSHKAGECVHTLESWDPRVRDAAIEVNRSAEGEFLRRNVRGDDVWLMRRVIFQGSEIDQIKRVDLIWIRGTASVNDRVM
eukprot:Hpha_TRINITY_DN18850_c0_g1::TRINITY_DN18850_c0_g1_i1::g.26356::m.26356